MKLIRKLITLILFNCLCLKIYELIIIIALFNPLTISSTRRKIQNQYYEKKIQHILFNKKKLVELWIDKKVIDIISNKKFLLFISKFLRKEPPINPIFIISSPRSGSSIFHNTLSQNKQLSSLKREIDEFWHKFTKNSDYLDETAVNDKTKKLVYTFFRLVSKNKPFVDKTISNTLKIRFLHKLFPDAKFIFITRKGQDTVNSLINGWQHNRFVSPWFKNQLKNWHFVLLPNWKSLINKPIPIICLNQWLICNQEILKNKPLIKNQITIKHEDFIKNSTKTIKSVFNFLNIELDEKTLNYAKELKPLDLNIVTLPKKDKWKKENRKQIENILQLIKPMNKKLGY